LKKKIQILPHEQEEILQKLLVTQKL
jgi:hypothetical protein